MNFGQVVESLETLFGENSPFTNKVFQFRDLLRKTCLNFRSHSDDVRRCQEFYSVGKNEFSDIRKKYDIYLKKEKKLDHYIAKLERLNKEKIEMESKGKVLG